jgi:hypothetical protein
VGKEVADKLGVAVSERALQIIEDCVRDEINGLCVYFLLDKPDSLRSCGASSLELSGGILPRFIPEPLSHKAHPYVLKKEKIA